MSVTGRRVAGRALRAFNDRHPWSHNDHFHPWIVSRLPRRRRAALDVGCGQGGLAAVLSPHFDEVVGVDADPQMRRDAARRCADLANVTIVDLSLEHLGTGRAPDGRPAPPRAFDLVTMVAVLHHLDAADALTQVRRLLAPGGRLLVVGLAPPATVRDHAWDLASAVTNPVIGLIRHPRPSTAGPPVDPFPVAEPTMPFDELRALVETMLPGARMRRRLGFRHTIEWQVPG